MERPFVLYPAIDLKGGKVVRLRQGKVSDVTVYGDDPSAVAKRWEDEGASYLHVVDLDGAFEGAPRNWESIRAILRAVRIPIQIGGGLRTLSDVAAALELGVTRVVVGTKACDSEEFVRSLIEKFGKRVVVGIDARDGFVAVKGWQEKSSWTALDFAKRVDESGVATIVFTDVSTDGMLAGPNYTAIASVCGAVGCHVIASGGVSRLDDVQRLRQLAGSCPNLVGVIIGKALYDNRIDLKEAVR